MTTPSVMRILRMSEIFTTSEPGPRIVPMDSLPGRVCDAGTMAKAVALNHCWRVRGPLFVEPSLGQRIDVGHRGRRGGALSRRVICNANRRREDSLAL